MATLVLSTVGSALGGPIGGALGGLVGQSIDRSLLGSGKGKGPRLGDLSVQSSSYGSPIPRMFGTMRVAGTVVWSTDMVEGEASGEGGKGTSGSAPRSYYVSLAVALSSRPILAVRRIWADGKLIRGASGDFKVRTKFRLRTGHQDQEIDPLIASVETIARTPAYRGIAMAVFEEFELAEFGNRIPMLTFEIVADEDAVTIGEILGDCSDGILSCLDSDAVTGFAAYGSSVKECVKPLVEQFDADLIDRHGKLESPPAAMSWALSDDELGCSAGEPKARVEQLRASASELPSSAVLTFYDPDRDCQAGQMRASGYGAGQRELRTELAAVVTANIAKKLVEQGLARELAKARSVKVSLPPSRMSIRPGDAILLPGTIAPLKVQAITLDGLAIEVEAVPAAALVASLPADAGRHLAEADVAIGRTELMLFELPAMGAIEEDRTSLYLAGSNQGQWKPVPVDIVLGSEPLPSQTLTRRATLGRAINALSDQVPAVLDDLSDVTVQLINPEQYLLNVDRKALAMGANLALLGGELIQFGHVEALGIGKFRLTKLLRGCFGTEWAAATHAAGETFLVIDSAAIVKTSLPPGAEGAIARACANGIGDRSSRPAAECLVGGEAIRPLSPCHLQLRRECNTLRADWVGRSRQCWSWSDEFDPRTAQPARFRVSLSTHGSRTELETTGSSATFDLDAIAAISGEVATISVTSIGTRALSRPITANFTI